MSVIRTLSASESDEQRDKERQRLERELARSDERLRALVETHERALAKVADVFANTERALTSANEAHERAAGRLSAARGLLRPRAQDLRRLWRAARAHHHALLMLTHT